MAKWWEDVWAGLDPVTYLAKKGWDEASKGPDTSGIDKGEAFYQQMMQKAMDGLQGHEAQGRGDITKGISFLDPYRKAGAEATEAYKGSLGIGGGGAAKSARQSFTESPGYQFALKEGLQSGERAAAAGGMTGSGAEQKALTRYGTGMAQKEYGGWQSKLAGLSGLGERASESALGGQESLANLGMGYGSAEAGLYGKMGQAGAESELAKAKLAAQSKQGLMSLLGQIFGIGGSVGGSAIAAFA